MLIKMIGFAFLASAAEVLVSGSRFEKYIKSVIGIVFIAVVLASAHIPGGFETGFLYSGPEEYGFSEEEERFSKELDREILLALDREARKALEKEGISVKTLIIDFDSDHSVKKIRVAPEREADGEKTKNILADLFETEKEVVEICSE